MVALDLPAKSQESAFTDLENTDLENTRLVSSLNVSVRLDFWAPIIPMAESTRNLRLCQSYNHDFYSDSTPSPPPSTPEEPAIDCSTPNHDSRLDERESLQQEFDNLVNLPIIIPQTRVLNKTIEVFSNVRPFIFLKNREKIMSFFLDSFFEFKI